MKAGGQMIAKIVSGGQSGVDRAAFDAALACGVAIGGWCPQGRRAEDGAIPGRYPMTETPAGDYATRTKWNVRDSDATLILAAVPLNGGTGMTAGFARRLGRPCLILDPAAGGGPQDAGRWVDSENIAVLNIAGPRESKQPGIYSAVLAFVEEMIEIDRMNAGG